MSSGQETAFECQSCGHRSPKWMGRCPSCGEWDSLVERTDGADSSDTSSDGASLSGSAPSSTGDGMVRLEQVDRKRGSHTGTGIEEFDRVTGGGLVPASVTLLGGPPGVGKSTLLLQLAGKFPTDDPVVYVTAEEAAGQLSQRADRLGVERDDLMVLASTELAEASSELKRAEPGLAVIDSIQALRHPDLNSSPGSVAQVRRCASHLTDLAKQQGFPLVLVGHVTKEGHIAGPKVLEHIVDVVLQMETDRNQRFRTLRALKNRFGSTSELGLFLMDEDGMHSQARAVSTELENMAGTRPGSCHGVVLEGSRAILVEVQALVSQSAGNYANRVALGIPRDKLNLIAALMEKRVGLELSGRDIHLSVVGGLSFSDPALDLAVAGAIYSSFYERPPDPRTVLIGELDLSARVRSVPDPERRLRALDRFEIGQVLMNYDPGDTAGSGADGPTGSFEAVLQTESLTHALAEAFSGQSE